MSKIALGVTGGIGAYKAVEVARGLQKAGHDVVVVMTQGGHRVRRPADLRSHHAPPRDHRPVRARRQRRHRAHRARLVDRPAARGAGDGEHHRQVRLRHRRRLPQLALPGDDGAGAAGAGDEHEHVGARGGAGEPAHAPGEGRGGRRARRGIPGLRVDRARAGWPSRTRSSRRPRRSCGRRRRSRASACS